VVEDSANRVGGGDAGGRFPLSPVRITGAPRRPHAANENPIPRRVRLIRIGVALLPLGSALLLAAAWML
jgi:hypothetical protein